MTTASAPKKRRYKPKPKPLYTPNLYAVLSGDTLTLNPREMTGPRPKHPPPPPKKSPRK